MSKRLVALVYLVLFYIVMSTIFKYILKSFVIFCVIYTLQDCYKKRRKFMWVIYFIKGNVHIVTYALIGEEMHSMCLSKPKRLKKKI